MTGRLAIMNNLSAIKPYTPSFKATPPQKQAEGNYTFYEMNDGVLPYAAISKHRKNQKAGKEDDHITQTVMKHLTSPKRLIKGFLLNLCTANVLAPLLIPDASLKKCLPIALITSSVMTPFSHFITVGASAKVEMLHEQGKKADFINEFFHNFVSPK